MEHIIEPENQNTTGTIIHCDEMLDIRQAADLKEKLLLALESLHPITIQAEAVERTDTAGLQLLAAFFIEARARDIGITWEQPSDSLIKSASLIGLGEILGLEQQSN